MRAVNLNELARQVAVEDDPKGLNMSMAEVKAVLAGLGRLMRRETIGRVVAICLALYTRAGRSQEE